MEKRFQFGIEEELFLADAMNGGAPGRSLKAFHATVHQQLPKTERELMEFQVEIASPPSTSFDEARAFLASQRSELARIGSDHGIMLLASGTHPLAIWSKQKRTNKARYQALSQEMQMIARRNIVCGMHVHVEVPDPDCRVDLMNRLLPYTPLLLALSASSPFWQGQNTGLAAYRMSVWGELPRTGLPDLFSGKDEYERYVATMVSTGAIKDASFLWWMLRPSIHYPTLELRVADSCTKLDDTLAIAALYRCLVRRAVRIPRLNHGLTGASRAIISENLWRAQRDGVRAEFIDEMSGSSTPCAEYLDLLLDQLVEDMSELECASEVERTKDIIASGTSADHQLKVLTQSQKTTISAREVIKSVVDWIARVTAGE